MLAPWKRTVAGSLASKLVGLLPRIPVLAFALMLAASAVHASCGGVVPGSGVVDDAEDGGLDDPSGLTSRDDAEVVDAPSEDAPEDRADGMSYGDAYIR